MTPRSIALITSSRADWGIQRPVAAALRSRTDVKLQVIACGMHLSHACGHTVDQIRADGFAPIEINAHPADDSAVATAAAMGEGVREFAAHFAKRRPDLVTVLGDRFDMFPAAVAAAPLRIPVAHLHGGELTFGAFDDALRHALTKLSHIHLASTHEYARRVCQMGENPMHVHVVGAPGLDDLLALEPLPPEVLAAEFGFRPGGCNALAIYHPETLAENSAAGAVELFAGLNDIAGAVVIVRPNDDPGNAAVHREINAYRKRNPQARAVASIDRRTFLSLMRAASVMVGNSSSGIIEAPSFGTPVVNVGDRQAGRVRAANVIDCPAERGAIRTALRQALDPAFRRGLTGLKNPYGDGQSGPRIAEILARTPLTDELLQKRFCDWPEPARPA